MTTLSFTTIELPVGDLGAEASVPDIAAAPDGQNRTRFELPDGDPVASGYGQLPNAYPYRKYLEYARETRTQPVPAAVLQNGFLRAVFLPGYGGRLWSLTDLEHGRELVYSNDVLRASNLAVRDAWFSGGVEWNVGVIGHTPLTMDALFAGRVSAPDGSPVLRMWCYERIRGVVYTMDFWLPEGRAQLCAAITLRNTRDEIVPMYWWTNIAMPLSEGARVFAPAARAYTDAGDVVTLVDLPVVDAVDVSYPGRVPRARDFFFAIPPEAPKFLAAVGDDGYGLLHSSSARLASRKLFVWGASPTGEWWQRFLTDRAGPYFEVQAGLGPTQYACIPMPAGAEWSWLERFEPIALGAAETRGSFDEVSARLTADAGVADGSAEESLAARLRAAPVEVVWRGNGDARLENALRRSAGLPRATELDVESDDPRPRRWEEFVRSGVLEAPADGEVPEYDVVGPHWAALLRAAADDPDRENWYVLYSLGLVELEGGDTDAAFAAITRSLELTETPWARYALAVLHARRGDADAAIVSARQAIDARPDDLSLAKSALRILRDAEAWPELLAAVGALRPALQADGRIRFLRALALHALGRQADARAVLDAEGGLELADLREGDDALAALVRAVDAALAARAD